MLAQDNANLFWHQANTSLGIGTTSPNNGLTVSKASSGSIVRIDSINTSTTAGSSAWFVVSVAGASAGDPVVVYDISGVLNWAVGVDNSDSDKFKIASSAALGTNDRLSITTAGVVDVPGSLTCPLYSSTSTLTLKTEDKTNAATSATSIGTGDVTMGNGSSGSGTVTIQTGVPQPNSSGSSSAGNSGTVTLSTGPGGAASGGSNPGVSGNLLLKTGTGGGNAAASSTGGNAGHIILQPGSGGSGTLTTGAGGSTIVRASNSGDILAVQNSAGTTTHLGVANNGNVRVGASAATARLHLGAGTNALAPLNFTGGTLLTSPAAGAVEWDGSKLYITSGTLRKELTQSHWAVVTDFGAKGDGTTDDAQAARDAVLSVRDTGGIVYFPPNLMYAIGSTIEIRSYYPIFIVSDMSTVAGIYDVSLGVGLSKGYIKPVANLTNGIFHWFEPDGEAQWSTMTGGGGAVG